MLVGLAFVVAALGAPVEAADTLDPYLGDPGATHPNLVPDVGDVFVHNYRLVQHDVDVVVEDGLFLLFDTWAQNLGTVPVQITVDEIDTPKSSTVSQCVSWRLSDAHVCRATEQAGGYAWHAAHGHFHYEDFASYQLRRLDSGGRPDYTDAGFVAAADKVSFCFIDSRPVRDDARPTPFYETCLPTVQGISPGWTDIYDYDTPGQALPLDGLPDGRYALIVDLDYENTLRETSDADNYIEATVELSGMGTSTPQVEIVERWWPAPDDRGEPTTTKKPKKPKKLKN